MYKNRLMKVLAVISTAIMAVSAAGVTAAADYTDTTEMVSSVETTSEKSMALQSGQAAAGETVEIPLTMFTNNQCMIYSISIEYDSRLEYVETDGAQAYEFEENGKKYISLAGFAVEPYADGETAATIEFKVPENAAVNDSFDVKIADVSSFSSGVEEFENYTASNASVTVIEGTETNNQADEDVFENKSGATVALEGKTAAPGQEIEIPVTLYAGNKCTSYDMSIEYDSRLEFVEASGAMFVTPYEEDGRSYVAIVGFKTSPYKDGKAIAKLKFTVPEEVEEDTEYEVKVNNIANLLLGEESFSNAETVNTVVSVKGGKYNGNLFNETGRKGDANNDGKTDIIDAATIAKAVAGRNFSKFDEAGMHYGDVNGDGKLDIRDAAEIAKYIAKGRIW